jgi:hypothetical protein
LREQKRLRFLARINNFSVFFTANHNYFYWKKSGRNPGRNLVLILDATGFFKTAYKPAFSLAFFFHSGNTTGILAKGLRYCAYEKNMLSGLFPFRGKLSGAALARSRPLRAWQFPDYLLMLFLA